MAAAVLAVGKRAAAGGEETLALGVAVALRDLLELAADDEELACTRGEEVAVLVLRRQLLTKLSLGVAVGEEGDAVAVAAVRVALEHPAARERVGRLAGHLDDLEVSGAGREVRGPGG